MHPQMAIDLYLHLWGKGIKGLSRILDVFCKDDANAEKTLHLIPRSFLGDAKSFLFGTLSEFHFRDKRHLDSHGV